MHRAIVMVIVIFAAAGCGLSREFRRTADPDPVKRQRALLALSKAATEGRLGDADRARLAEKVRAGTGDTSALVRSAAVLAATAVLSPSEADGLARKALADDAQVVRLDAVRTMAALMAPGGDGALVERILGDADERVRHDAARALASWPPSAASAGALVDALAGDTPAVAAAAHASLVAAAGEDHGSNVYLWREWAKGLQHESTAASRRAGGDDSRSSSTK